MYDEQKVKEVARGIHDLLNVMGSDGPKALAMELAADHRTLVQVCFRELVLPLIELLDQQYENGRFDARNEGSVTLAHELNQVVKTSATPLPFI